MRRGDREALKALAEGLRSQDNAATKEPVFMVQERRRVYGVDSDFAEGQCRVETNVDHREVGYVDVWVGVTPFFTRQGAEDYIAANAHRLTEPRVYVDSAYRNDEWQLMRRLALNGARSFSDVGWWIRMLGESAGAKADTRPIEVGELVTFEFSGERAVGVVETVGTPAVAGTVLGVMAGGSRPITFAVRLADLRRVPRGA